MLFKVSGIYNSESIKYLQSSGVNHFAFDFRPKSFNFIQKHIVSDLVKSHFYAGNKIYLHFENEKEFIINDIISSLSFADINLEFSGNESVEFVDSFKKPFAYHFINFDNFSKIVNSRYLAAIVFDYDFLLYMYNKNKLETFVIKYFQIIKNKKYENKLLTILGQNWDNEIFEGIVHYFKFDIYNFKVDLNVENGFRNINLDKVGKYLNHWTNI